MWSIYDLYLYIWSILTYTFSVNTVQTFGAFRLTLFPLWPGLASFPSCLGRRVPVRLQIRPNLITIANQNVLSHILFEGWTENNMPWCSASCAVFFWMDLTKGLASHTDDLRSLSFVFRSHKHLLKWAVTNINQSQHTLYSGATYLWISKVVITCLCNKLKEIQKMIHVDDSFNTCKSTTWPFLDNTGHLRDVP